MSLCPRRPPVPSPPCPKLWAAPAWLENGHAGAVRDPREARHGGHGGRVQGAARRAGQGGRPEGAAGRRDGRGQRRPVQERDPGDRPARPPQHRRRPRRGRAGRRPLPGDGLRRRAWTWPGSSSATAACPSPTPARRSARRRSGLQHAFEQRPGPPRRQAVQPHAGPRRPGPGARPRAGAVVRGGGRGHADRPGGMLLGTADYLAPEQWEHAHAADTRADIYSLGCTLYHLLAGRPPFAGEQYQSVLQKMRAHLEAPPPPIAAVRPGRPGRARRRPGPDAGQGPRRPVPVARRGRRGAAAVRGGRRPRPPARRRRGRDAPARIAAAAAPTPAPGLWETAAERTGRGRRPARTAPPYALPVAWRALPAARRGLARSGRARAARPGRPRSRWRSRSCTSPTTATTATKDMLLGDLRTSSERRPSERQCEIAADLTAPAYYYLIAFNPQGSEAGIEQLCQPEERTGQRGGGRVRPDRRAEVRYPRTRRLHPRRRRASGVRARRLDEAAAGVRGVAGQAGTIPWEGVEGRRGLALAFRRPRVLPVPPERGRVEPKEDVPESLRKLCEFFKGRPEFDAVQIVAFPVADDQK